MRSRSFVHGEADKVTFTRLISRVRACRLQPIRIIHCVSCLQRVKLKLMTAASGQSLPSSWRVHIPVEIITWVSVWVSVLLLLTRAEQTWKAWTPFSSLNSHHRIGYASVEICLNTSIRGAYCPSVQPAEHISCCKSTFQCQ